jgi:hypothetical protein
MHQREAAVKFACNEATAIVMVRQIKVRPCIIDVSCHARCTTYLVLVMPKLLKFFTRKGTLWLTIIHWNTSCLLFLHRFLHQQVQSLCFSDLTCYAIVSFKVCFVTRTSPLNQGYCMANLCDWLRLAFPHSCCSSAS